MSNIKQALTRKLGPLPAWAWALLAGGTLFWYRRYSAGAAAATAAQNSNLGYYGPYGQDAYPITGGAGTGGLGGGIGGGGDISGAGTGTTSNPFDAGPPVINVTPPPDSTNGTNPRAPKPNRQTAAQRAAYNRTFNRRWLRAHPRVVARREAAYDRAHPRSDSHVQGARNRTRPPTQTRPSSRQRASTRRRHR